MTLRITIELLPFGNQARARTIGLMEIANDTTGTKEQGNYRVLLRKTPPWKGALKAVWRQAELWPTGEDAEVLTGSVEGHDRQQRGVYDLLYRALVACGIGERNC
ncbi:MAG: hypothetical protein AAFN18_11850 [Cyanobacteria bacterium J06554_6]